VPGIKSITPAKGKKKLELASATGLRIRGQRSSKGSISQAFRFGYLEEPPNDLFSIGHLPVSARAEIVSSYPDSALEREGRCVLLRRKPGEVAWCPEWRPI